jgi:hypothetical protein
MRRKKSIRRDWRTLLFLILSLIIALSMALAYIIPALNN